MPEQQIEINIFGNFYNYYPEESDNVTGDIDGDGKLTKNDVTIIKDAVLGDGDLTEEEKQAYDVNGDGTFNILDYINIKNIFNEMLDARSDINGDGEINAADVALMKQAVMNSSEIEDIDAYDLNGDGEINILDII